MNKRWWGNEPVVDGWRVFSVADFGYGADDGLSVSAM